MGKGNGTGSLYMEEIKQKKKRGTGFKHLGKLLFLVSPNSENGATQ